MAPTSWNRRPSRRAGYSLVETMTALAILAAGAAVVVPSGLRQIEQTRAHAAFLDFQRQVSGLRLKAYSERRPMVVGQAVALEAPWSYRLAAPLRIGGDGACDPASAELIHDGRPVMRLESPGRDCRFIQVLRPTRSPPPSR